MRRIILISCFLAIFSIPALAYEYLPLEPGITWTYQTDIYATTLENVVINDVETTPLEIMWPNYRGGTRYYLTDNGVNVTIEAIMIHEPQGIKGTRSNLPWFIDIPSSFQLFERPLTVGIQASDYDPGEGIYIIHTEVFPEEIISTPYGDLTVFPISLNLFGGDDFWANFYFHKELGLVGYNDLRLETIDGLTVPTEQQSWSDVKALYR